MDENQNSNPEQFNVAGTEKKKKGMGPLGGTLLAILIVFLMCVIGLLIRMVVAGDGDYFKPIKALFGIEEDDDETEKKSSKTKKTSQSPSFQSAERYSLLSDDVDGKDVKHYRLTIDVSELFDVVMEEVEAISDDDDDDYETNTSKQKDVKVEEKNSAFSELDNLEDTIVSMASLFSEVKDIFDGEIYFDIYFEENDIVQVVAGYDYGALLENLYDYLKDEGEDELEAQNINSAEDLANYIVNALDEYIDEDKLYDLVIDSASAEFESTLKQLGIKEKDVKEAIDFVNDKGVFEFYINGTTKLKGLVSMMLDNEDFQASLEEIEDEMNIKIDKDNIFESVIEAVNETDEYSEFGFEFVEVK